MSVEKKFVDFDLGTPGTPLAVIDTAYTVFTGGVSAGSFLGIAQGDDQNQRIGRKIVVTDLLWNGTVNLKGSIPGTADVVNSNWDEVRIIMYIDKQCNGAALSPKTLLVQTEDIETYRNIENASRFQVIWDKRLKVHGTPLLGGNGSATEMAVGSGFNTFKYHWRGRLPVEYDSSFVDGRISTIRTNNIGAVVVSNNVNPVTTEIYGHMRVRFYG